MISSLLVIQLYVVITDELYVVITDELCAIWEKTGIKAQRKDKVKQKLTNLYESYRTLNKHKGRNDEKSQLFLYCTSRSS